MEEGMVEKIICVALKDNPQPEFDIANVGRVPFKGGDIFSVEGWVAAVLEKRGYVRIIEGEIKREKKMVEYLKDTGSYKIKDFEVGAHKKGDRIKIDKDFAEILISLKAVKEVRNE